MTEEELKAIEERERRATAGILAQAGKDYRPYASEDIAALVAEVRRLQEQIAKYYEV